MRQQGRSLDDRRGPISAMSPACQCGTCIDRLQFDVEARTARAAGIDEPAVHESPSFVARRFPVRHIGRAAQYAQLMLPVTQRAFVAVVDFDDIEQRFRALMSQPCIESMAECAEVGVFAVAECEHAVAQAVSGIDVASVSRTNRASVSGASPSPVVLTTKSAVSTSANVAAVRPRNDSMRVAVPAVASDLLCVAQAVRRSRSGSRMRRAYVAAAVEPARSCLRARQCGRSTTKQKRAYPARTRAVRRSRTGNQHPLARSFDVASRYCCRTSNVAA